jgi:hypothetical protein
MIRTHSALRFNDSEMLKLKTPAEFAGAATIKHNLRGKRDAT